MEDKGFGAQLSRRSAAAVFALIARCLCSTPVFAQCTLNGSSAPCVLDGTQPITSGYLAPLGTTTKASGTLTNTSNIQINGGSETNTLFYIVGNTTLQGTGGTLTLNSTNGIGSAFLLQSGGNFTLTNATNTIQGYGNLGNGSGLALANNSGGTISANVSGGETLNLNPGGGITNAGLINATGGGILYLTDNVANTGGNITAATGSKVNIGSTITGGVLNTSGTGFLGTAAGSTAGLSGVTISTASTYTGNTGTITNITGTITNQGTIRANGGTVAFGGSADVQGGSLQTLNGGVMGTLDGANATLDGTAATLRITTGSQWTNGSGSITSVAGTINNQGNIQLNTDGGASILNLIGNTTLQGGGTVTLNSGLGLAQIAQNGGAYTLTNTNNTIQGWGYVVNAGLSLTNSASGVVNANASGEPLFLNAGGTVINQGLLEATNGAGLVITDTVANTGTISANGGTVSFSGSADVQGSLQTLNGGVMGTLDGANATLDGTANTLRITTGSQWTNGTGSITSVAGTINNQGNIQLNTNGGNSTLNLIGNTTLQGGGTVTLNSGFGLAQIAQNGGAYTLTNTDNTIQGWGYVGNAGMSLTNSASGIVNANASGEPLFLNAGGTVINQGLLEATNGAGLVITDTVANTGTIRANGGTVAFSGSAVVQGGSLQTLNGGVMGTLDGANATLDGTANTLTLTLTFGSQWTNGTGSITSVAGTINNQGNIQLNADGGASILNLIGNTTLEGGGTVTLNSASGLAQIAQNGGAYTLTNTDNTIQGYGYVGNGGMSLTNSAGGVVNANAIGQALFLNAGGTVINQGLMEATNGGALAISDTVNNQGNIQLNGGGNHSSLYLIGNTTLEGGGTVTLNSTDLNGYSQIAQNGGAYTLTNTNNTIQGYGHVGNGGGLTLVNNGGTLLANVSGKTLFLDGTGGLNNTGGTMQANAGTLLHSTQGFTNFSAGTLTGGTYNAGTASTLGGTIQIDAFGIAAGAGGEVLTNSATIVLSGASALISDANGLNALSAIATNTSNGSFSLLSGVRLATSASTYSNAGFMDIGSGSTFTVGIGGTGSGTGGYNQNGGTTSVDGVLDASLADITGGLLTGIGTVKPGASHALIIGGSLVEAQATVAPGDGNTTGALTVDGNYDQTNEGELLIGLASTGNDFLHIEGAANFAGALEFDLINGFRLQSGYFFFIADYDSEVGAFTPDFTGLDLSGLTAQVLYNQGAAGNEVELLLSRSATPEPSTWFLFAGGLGFIAAFGLRKSRATPGSKG